MRNLEKLWKRVSRLFEKIFRNTLFFFIAAYRTIGTTHLGGSCRFEPSCSEYALQAAKTHRFHRALWLVLKRLSKCRPGGPYGHDPLPKPQGEV